MRQLESIPDTFGVSNHIVPRHVKLAGVPAGEMRDRLGIKKRPAAVGCLRPKKKGAAKSILKKPAAIVAAAESDAAMPDLLPDELAAVDGPPAVVPVPPPPLVDAPPEGLEAVVGPLAVVPGDAAAADAVAVRYGCSKCRWGWSQKTHVFTNKLGCGTCRAWAAAGVKGYTTNDEHHIIAPPLP